jgi:hypothetical protein
VTADAQAYKNFTTSFMSILKQVAEHWLPKLYDYYRTPAPFIQVTLPFPSFNKSWIFTSSMKEVTKLLADWLLSFICGVWV